MPDDKLTRLLRRFIAVTQAHFEALEAMDEARANSHAQMIAALYKAIRQEGIAGQAGLFALVDSDLPVVAGMAAVYSMEVDPEICLMTLRRVAAEPGLLGFRASVVIERWEAGAWEHPGKQS
jgi:hypothetical protein